MAGVAYFVCIALGINHGFTFSNGWIDYIVLFPKSTNALWLFVLGPIWAVVFFLVFSFFIRQFKLPTPGREAMDEAAAAAHTAGGGCLLAADRPRARRA